MVWGRNSVCGFTFIEGNNDIRAILVVDDDYAFRLAIKSMMDYLFPTIEVLEAENGCDGVSIAQAEKPDMILRDGNMPVMNGYETAKVLKKLPHASQTSLIGISGNNPNDRITYGLRQLCDAWLPKPFAMDDLLELMTSCMKA
jgi:CheY-like chemotaxis protein